MCTDLADAIKALTVETRRLSAAIELSVEVARVQAQSKDLDRLVTEAKRVKRASLNFGRSYN